MGEIQSLDSSMRGMTRRPSLLWPTPHFTLPTAYATDAPAIPQPCLRSHDLVTHPPWSRCWLLPAVRPCLIPAPHHCISSRFPNNGLLDPCQCSGHSLRLPNLRHNLVIPCSIFLQASRLEVAFMSMNLTNLRLPVLHRECSHLFPPDRIPASPVPVH